MKFHRNESRIAASNKQNVKVVTDYLNKAFNRNTEVSWEHMQSKVCKLRIDRLAYLIDFTQFSTAIDKLMSQKVLGLNRVSHSIIKALNNHNYIVLFKFTRD